MKYKKPRARSTVKKTVARIVKKKEHKKKSESGIFQSDASTVVQKRGVRGLIA